MPQGTKWTAGRSLLALIVIAFGFPLIAAGVSTAFSSIHSLAATLNTTGMPPELQLIQQIVAFVAWTLSVPVFIAILIAASLIKEALERE